MLKFRSNCHNVFVIATRLKNKINLRYVNHGLTILAVGLGLFILLSPFLPRLLYRLHQPRLVAQSVVQVVPQNTLPATPIADGPELKIPRLNMTETIHTGTSTYELNKGVWLVPHTSSPDQASNTVIIGHRFTYAGPAVFYFLDKVQLDDRITVDWQRKEYTYQVITISVVSPTTVAVQNATSKPLLTLYTCTPLITAKNRLVITASLVGVRS